MTELSTRKMVVLSTGHLTWPTIMRLTRTTDWPVFGAVTPFGFVVYAHPEGEADADCPPELLACCTWAEKQGFDYIWFDGEEEPIDDLPSFQHESGKAEEEPAVIPRRLYQLLQEMVDYEAGAFDGPADRLRTPGAVDEEEESSDVNGGDLVDAFIDWRTEIKAFLAGVAAPAEA